MPRTKTPDEISDEKLERAISEHLVTSQILEILKTVAPPKRLLVLRAVALLTLGKDLSEI